ncbi:MAG: FAD-dependent oxidoreductase [Comamonadaceae bacterium]|nr:FAD-dependent oxidoreductase [Comamonadaceae bacterium]
MPCSTPTASSTRDSVLRRHRAARAAPSRRWPATPRCDVAVVGGGLAGLSAAIDLRRPRLRRACCSRRARSASAPAGATAARRSTAWPATRPTIEAQLGLDDGAPRLGDVDRGAGPAARAHRALRHRLRLARRLPRPGHQRAQGRASCRPGRDRIEPVYGYPLQRIAPAEIGRWIASPRYHSGVHDPRSGHLHPLKYTLGLARARRGGGRAPARAARRCWRWRRAQRPRAAHRRRQRCARGRCCWPATSTCSGRRAGAGSRASCRWAPTSSCSEALDPTLADSLIPSRSAVCDTNFVLDYFRTTTDHRLLYGGRVSYSTADAGRTWPRACARRMVRTFPQLAGAAGRVRLGRLRRHLDEPRARLRPPARCAAARRQRVLPAGLLRPRPGAHRPGRHAWWPRRWPATPRASTSSPACATAASPAARALRTPALVLGMAWYRLRDMLG